MLLTFSASSIEVDEWLYVIVSSETTNQSLYFQNCIFQKSIYIGSLTQKMVSLKHVPIKSGKVQQNSEKETSFKYQIMQKKKRLIIIINRHFLNNLAY